jgi:hypothetical protein
MSEHIDIFEDLYSIREHISDGYFLILNNKIKKLIQENRYLRKTIASIIPGESLTIQFTHSSDENDDSIEIEYLDDDSDIEQECSCSTRCRFQDLIDIKPDFSDVFCINSMESMQNCENFKKLMEKIPLLENLFHKIDLPFIEEELYQEYVKSEFVLFTKIILFLLDNITNKRKKIIIFLVMYDFHIRNINFLIEHQRYAKSIYKKFEELLNDSDFIPLTLEYNVNYIRWLEILKKQISQE